MGGILQVDTIQNNNTSTIITQTNTTTITIGRTGQTITIPSGATFNASSASVNLPAINLSTGVTGTLPVANGGTNLTTYTTGDLLYASNATTLTKLGVGSSGQGLVVSGGLPAWGTSGPSAGQVIQVKTATDSSTRTTSSTSFTAASNTLSVSITPASASNKMFLMANLGSSGSENDQAIYFTIYRDSTNLGTANYGFSSIYTYVGDVGSTLSIPASMSYLDSPSTTSSITYQVRFRASAGTVGMNEISPSLMSLTVMEIKG
jgi:hypothetical protein